MNIGYPIMLNIEGKQCVVVGGGKIATRKIQGLHRVNADVIVISPTITSELQRLVDQSKIKWVNQAYQPNLLTQYHPTLIFAATDSHEVNQQVAQDAQLMNVIVNIANDSERSNFANMPTIDRLPISISVSSNGASPALAKHIKTQIINLIGDEYSTLAQWLGKIRSTVSEEITHQPDRQRLYEAIIESEVLELLHDKQTERAKERFQQLLDEGFNA